MIAAGVTGAVVGVEWLESKIEYKVGEALIVAKASGEFKGGQGPVGQRGEKGERGESGQSSEEVGIPSGLVIASWKRCETLGEDWSDFHAAGGRMIIGAGDPVNDPFEGKLTERIAWTSRMKFPTEATVGGAEEVKLEKQHLPPHEHEVTWGGQHTISLNTSTGNVSGDNRYRIPFTQDGRAGNNMIAKSRDVVTKPHPNMPPYVALYFCKKN